MVIVVMQSEGRHRGQKAKFAFPTRISDACNLHLLCAEVRGSFAGCGIVHIDVSTYKGAD